MTRSRNMVTVEEAERIVLEQVRNFGTELVAFADCLGRVLAEPIVADRDLPPFDRVTMDGIAVRYGVIENNVRQFKIKATQAAGDDPIDITDDSDCIEIMTGCVLPSTVDTVIPYEDIEIRDGMAVLRTNAEISFNQSIHFRGRDKKQGEVLVESNQFITPNVVTIAAAVGKTAMEVKQHPKIVIISTGNELVDVADTPSASQVRRSNNYTLESVLREFGLSSDTRHLPDDKDTMRTSLAECLTEYDIILLSGGVSMGKFDLLPEVLSDLQVEKLFHKVKQRPGKPFWFGTHPDRAFVFAFPGNPVSTFMCFNRYFLPWLKKCFGVKSTESFAVLNGDVSFGAPLKYFLPVGLEVDNYGVLRATPLEGNGSGDFANLLLTEAFMELPLEQNEFKTGDVYPIWQFKNIYY